MEKACKDCLVTLGVVSYEECIGCNGLVNCNATYFSPKKKTEIFTKDEKFEMERNRFTDITQFSTMKINEFLSFIKKKIKRDKDKKIYIIK